MLGRLSFVLVYLILAGLLCIPVSAQSTVVIVNFDPSDPSIGPFPTDNLTAPDAAQKTGLRVHLPMPDCAIQPSDCTLISALNELDGFHLQPRIRVSFSGAIDASTLKAGIFFVWLDSLSSDEKGLGQSGRITAVNQVIFDPIANTAYAKPDESFDQHRRYALLVTDAVRDIAGNPVKPDPKFTACIDAQANDYCARLKKAVAGATLPGNIVAASVFTTMSATAWLENVRDLLPQVALGFAPLGTPVKTASFSSVALKAQVGTKPVSFTTFAPPLPADTLAGLDRIVPGTYQSPNFLSLQQSIPDVPTGTIPPLPAANNTIVFHAYIPSSPMPVSGYPVVIYGHAFGENSFYTPTLLASSFAKAGFVTLAINAVGHGFGSQSLVDFVQQGKVVAEFSAGGRGVDLNGDGQIAVTEGCFVGWPLPVGIRDCLRQTATDLLQLENLVRSGTAIEPSGSLKLDASNVYYAGLSLGGFYGTLFHAVNPHVRTAALNVGGGSLVDTYRWSAVYHSFGIQVVGGHVPSLLNAGSNYDENYVLRDQPPRVNTVTGAIVVQNLLDNLEWLGLPGDPLSFSPHFSRSPLNGVPAKRALFQFAFGDQSVPNPAASAWIRAAGMFSTSSLYRADIAAPIAVSFCCSLPANPHPFLADATNQATWLISRVAQQQIAGFLASDGKTIPDANAALKLLLPMPATSTVFETPAGDVETLNFPWTPPAVPPPAITKVLGITGGGAISQNTWIEILGTNLAPETRLWTGSDFSGRQMPTALESVSVTVNGKEAFVEYISQNQVNVLTPLDNTSGNVQVQLTVNGRTTAAPGVPMQPYTPGFFLFGSGPYAAATHADGRYLGPANLYPGLTTPAKPGEVVVLYGAGFGQTSPLVVNGAPTQSGALTTLPAIAIAGVQAKVQFAGVISPGLYQFNVEVPDTISDGDNELTVEYGGFTSPAGVMLAVQKQ